MLRENHFIHLFIYCFQSCGKQHGCRQTSWLEGNVDPKAKRRKAAFNFRIPALHFPAAGGGRLIFSFFSFFFSFTPNGDVGEQMLSCGHEHVHHLPALIKAFTCMCKNGARAPAHAHITCTVWRGYSLRARHGTELCMFVWDRESARASPSTAEERNTATMRRF